MIQENIQKVREILNRYTTIDYAFIFGSFLNKPLHESDVDILLGASLTASEQLDLSMELELLLKRKVDIVLATDAPCELVLNAFSKGLPIFIKDRVLLKRDILVRKFIQLTFLKHEIKKTQQFSPKK